MEATEANPAPRALDGLRVIELGSSASVAVAGLVLADNGADVIGVEPPTGSALRPHAAFAMGARGRRGVGSKRCGDGGGGGFGGGGLGGSWGSGTHHQANGQAYTEPRGQQGL